MAKTIEDMQKDYEALEASTKAAKDRIAELEREKAFGGMLGDTDEKRLLRVFGASDVKSLLEKNIGAPEYAHASISDRMAALELKKQVDIARWYSQMFEGAQKDQGELDDPRKIASVKGLLDNRAAKNFDLKGKIKAFGTDVAGAGAEWIETAISSSYIEEYMLEKKVANLFTEIPMPTNPFKLPQVASGTVAEIVGEGQAATEDNGGTGAITFDAKHKLVKLYNLPEELNEDSAVTFLTIGRNQILDAQIRAIETALINGDADGTHMDMLNAYAAKDARRAVDGLRKIALGNSANGGTVDFGAAVGETKLDTMIAQAGKFSLNPRECLFIVSPQIYHQMTSLTNVLTVDKFGPMATILNGLLAAYKGRGIVASEYLSETMDASGIVAAGGTKGGILLVNKTRFFLGRRRPIKIRVAMDSRAEYDRWQLASYQRMDFQGCEQSASEVSVVYGYNVTL
jgi:HK97 family phage major capsid protein